MVKPNPLKQMVLWKKHLLLQTSKLLTLFRHKAEGDFIEPSHDEVSFQPLPDDVPSAVQALCAELNLLEDAIVSKETAVQMQEEMLRNTQKILNESKLRKKEILRSITLLNKVKEIQDNERARERSVEENNSGYGESSPF